MQLACQALIINGAFECPCQHQFVCVQLTPTEKLLSLFILQAEYEAKKQAIIEKNMRDIELEKAALAASTAGGASKK